MNTCTSIFDIFFLLTTLFCTQNGLDCIYGNRIKDLTKKCFDELHSTKSYRKNKQVPYQCNSHATSQTAIYAKLISLKPVILGCIVAGFGSFWLVLLVLWVILAGFVGGFGWFRA